ncbi:hypothetical protein BE221DRAFT_190260 [Ostreococcus tauri]|uniref:Uncharacterized protein n=1 Tax=Ostreococcus tauri TaxID=70448 RepID=A0A1Y5IEB2_OSTTA|nr:hypothetical protein BE221DRAFT_190260 [Ostreococcus tauri]
MELWGTSDASDALWWLASHPAFGAAAVLGVVWLVPRAVDAAWKYVVLPGVILLLVVVVVTTPAEALGFFGAAAREVAGHPEEILAVTVVFAVIALGPYLVGGAIVALLISGATILPGVFKPLLPPEVVRATEQVDSIASRVREERSFFDSFAKEVNDKRTSLKMQRSNGNVTVSAPTLVENRTKPMKKTSATRAREDAIRVRERREKKRELEKRKQQYLADKTTAT